MEAKTSVYDVQGFTDDNRLNVCPPGAGVVPDTLKSALPLLSLATFFGRQVPRDVVNFSAFSTWPRGAVATLAVATARQPNLSCQVASKLALERYTHTICSSRRHPLQQGQINEASFLERAVRDSNQYIYQFAHKLAAGGKTAASLMGVLCGQNVVSIVRSGDGSAFLIRGKKLFPFFDVRDTPRDNEYLGVVTDPEFSLSTVHSQSGDIVLLFSETVLSVFQENLARLTDRIARNPHNAELLARSLFTKPEEQGYVIALRLNG
jgi:hypothetical protein